MKNISKSILLSFLLLTVVLKASTSDTAKVYIFNIQKEIGTEMWRNTKKAFSEAKNIKADLIIIHMNTYGGLLNAGDSIRTKILNSSIPTLVFIDNNAASAGALISIACNKIYMHKGSSIGAATVVDQNGKPLPDKYQSYMRSKMRATAESHGKDTVISKTGKTTTKWYRDPRIAEAMVDPSIKINNIIDTGKVITFTTNEAIKYGYCEGEAENIDEVLKKEHINNYTIVKQHHSTTDSIINMLINPFIHGLLIMIIIGGIYFELQTPGIGFPLGAAIIAAILYFAPLYIEGLAENWEIIISILGIILFILEIFVIPGFGIAGISGIVLLITGLSLSMVDNLEFQLNPFYAVTILKSVAIVITSSLTAFILSIWLSKKLLTNSIIPGIALESTQKLSNGFSAIDLKINNLLGKSGIAKTMLRPSGLIEIEGKTYDAIAEYGVIEKNTAIIVVKSHTAQLYVTEKRNS